MRTPHTGAPKGKRVYVRMRDGSRFIDKFMERTDSGVRFARHGWVRKSAILRLRFERFD